MNISDIDINFIEIFALSYTAASDIFEVDPVTASSKMKRKIRKWIDKIYVSEFIFLLLIFLHSDYQPLYKYYTYLYSVRKDSKLFRFFINILQE